MFERYGEMLSVPNVVEILQTSKNKIYKLLASGELKGMRMDKKQWRIKNSDLEEYINSKYTTTNEGGTSNATR